MGRSQKISVLVIVASKLHNSHRLTGDLLLLCLGGGGIRLGGVLLRGDGRLLGLGRLLGE